MKCNLQCAFCFINESKNINEVPFKKWIETINIAKEEGLLSLSILGGEPFLYKHIKELLLFTKQIEMPTTITTNDTSLSDDIIHVLKECNNVTTTISLQSLSDLNKRLTGVSYSYILSNIKKLLLNEISCRVNTVYTEQTEQEIIDLVDWVYNYDHIKKMSIAFYINKNYKNTIKSKKTYEILENLKR